MKCAHENDGARSSEHRKMSTINESIRWINTEFMEQLLGWKDNKNKDVSQGYKLTVTMIRITTVVCYCSTMSSSLSSIPYHQSHSCCVIVKSTICNYLQDNNKDSLLY